MSGFQSWVLHDPRRTCVSGMARLGVAPHVADKILNHQSGSISGVAAVYQRHEFLLERKAAVELWSEYVFGLVQPGSAGTPTLAPLPILASAYDRITVIV